MPGTRLIVLDQCGGRTVVLRKRDNKWAITFMDRTLGSVTERDSLTEDQVRGQWMREMEKLLDQALEWDEEQHRKAQETQAHAQVLYAKMLAKELGGDEKEEESSSGGQSAE